MGKVIARIEADYDDSMIVFNLIGELNTVLNNYGISVEVEDEEHDGFEVVIVSEFNMIN